MTHTSYWQNEHHKHYPQVHTNQSFDVVVIGGGITGVTSAYLLKQCGKKVCLLEKNEIAAGETSHTSAHLSYVTDSRFHELVKNFGAKTAAHVWNAGRAAIELVEILVENSDIECDFHKIPGYLVSHLDVREKIKKAELQSLKKDCIQAKAENFDAQYLEEVAGVNQPGVRFADQARFHPVKYVRGLARQIPGHGCEIYEQAEVTAIDDQAGQEKKLIVKVGDFEIQCDKVIVATHSPLQGSASLIPAALFQMKLYAYSSYVLSAQIPKGYLPEGLLWDIQSPYNYVRVDAHPEYDRIILGGKDHKTGQEVDTQQCYRELEELLDKMTPHEPVDFRWSGQVIETNDGLPYIGEFSPHQFIATGFSGNGLTFGTLAAMMATDYVFDRKNPWTDLFTPQRKKIMGGTWDYLIENLDYPFYFVKDILQGADKKDPESVGIGEGEIIKLNGEKVACARDEQGELHLCSAVCTHMGCVVRWNNAEHTWDCPCHGSRFKMTGEVIAGPAEKPLEAVTQIQITQKK
jgi:glycine/D-amino acid oxidase-like deaminating enzyme/nitrite reductase/ring-hydroxylating ferredoxin subunit